MCTSILTYVCLRSGTGSGITMQGLECGNSMVYGGIASADVHPRPTFFFMLMMWSFHTRWKYDVSKMVWTWVNHWHSKVWQITIGKEPVIEELGVIDRGLAWISLFLFTEGVPNNSALGSQVDFEWLKVSVSSHEIHEFIPGMRSWFRFPYRRATTPKVCLRGKVRDFINRGSSISG